MGADQRNDRQLTIGLRPFYKALENGDYDRQLESLYAELMAEGELFQARETATRAVSITGGADERKWVKRESSASGLITILDSCWLPDRLLKGLAREPLEPIDGRVVGFFKSSLPESQAGYAIRTQQTLQAQQSAGFEVHPFTPIGFGDTGRDSETVGNVTYARLKSTREFPTGSAPGDLETNTLALYESARPVRPSLIHAASGFIGPEMGLVGLSVAKDLGIPFVYEMRGVLSETWGYRGVRLQVQRQMSWLRWQQEVRLAREADAVVALSAGIRSELSRSGVDREKVFVVPNGVDVDVFSPRVAPPALKRTINPQDLPVVGYVSNLSRREGHLVLISAIAELKRQGLPVRCLIVGDGPMQTGIVRSARSLGIDELVSVVGPVPHEEIPDYYALLDIFVVPREDDRAARYTTPLKPYEAMAMSIPIVVSDLPALREIVGAEQERGLTFHTGNASSLAAQLRQLLENPSLAARLAEEGGRWVREERQWAHNGDRYREVFDFALGAMPA